jgi:hypothetical protein
MAVMALEDWHETAGTIEVVMFPRVWVMVKDYVRRHKEAKLEENGIVNDDAGHPEIEIGDILMVIGRLDRAREEAQIICEKVDFEGVAMNPQEAAQAYAVPVASWMVEEVVTNGNGSDQEPPPFFDYDEETGEMVQGTVMVAPPPVQDVMPATQGASAPTPAIEPQFGANHQEMYQNSNGSTPADDNNPFADILAAHTETREPMHISVHFQRSNDTDKDRRRLRRIHSTLIQYPGSDRFTIVIGGSGKPGTMDFPNHTTGWCEELRQDLSAIVGEENIKVSATKTAVRGMI